MIEIIQFPAKSGDSILIKVNSSYILIDGGYVSTYKNYIQEEIIKKNLSLELVICTHYDQDHIGGLIPLVNNYASIKRLWFNGFFQLFSTELSEHLNYAEKRKLNMEFGYISEDSTGETNISSGQGESLSIAINNKQYLSVNDEFSNQIVESSANVIEFQDFSIDIISPNSEAINKLREEWEKQLLNAISKKTKSCDPEILIAFENFQKIKSHASDINLATTISFQTPSICEALTEIPNSFDDSIINRCSISFILRSQAEMFLYLSDTDDEQIYNYLKKYNLDEFDGVKISHHGSSRNNWKWIEIIKSRTFFISTDGVKHYNHPSCAVIARIIINNPGCKLIFNYEIPRIKRFLEINHKDYDFTYTFQNTQNLNTYELRRDNE